MSDGPAARHDARSLAGRFLQLSGAAAVEGACSTAFLLYLAWRDAQAYGALMYGLAAAVIASKVVEFGLYYPLVTALGRLSRASAALLLTPVGLFRGALSGAALAAAAGFVAWRGLASGTALALLALVAGFAIEATAATAFAELRLRGLQRREARLRVLAAVLAYGYGFGCAGLGASAAVIALFKPLGAVLLVFGAWRSLEGETGPLAGAAASARQTQSALWKTLRPLLGAGLVLGSVDILGTLYNKTNIFFLEAATGATGVAVYSASWNVVDGVALLVSEQFLAWVLFPSLALRWAAGPDRAVALVRDQARVLFPAACAAMFVLYQESDVIIGFLYPTPFAAAAGLQRVLVFTIALAVLHNLWASLMIVAGAGRVLLGFAALTTGASLGFGLALVPRLGLLGGAYVIVLTKLLMFGLTTAYCQRRFRLFGSWDALSLLGPPALVLGAFDTVKRLVPLHLAVAVGLGCYVGLTWHAFSRAARSEAR